MSRTYVHIANWSLSVSTTRRGAYLAPDFIEGLRGHRRITHRIANSGHSLKQKTYSKVLANSALCVPYSIAPSHISSRNPLSVASNRTQAVRAVGGVAVKESSLLLVEWTPIAQA